jgi:hypothetical protein
MLVGASSSHVIRAYMEPAKKARTLIETFLKT